MKTQSRSSPAERIPAKAEPLTRVSFTGVLPFRCIAQERLRAQFQIELNGYNKEYAALLELPDRPNATEEMDPAYESCVKARLALEKHEREHGCRKP